MIGKRRGGARGRGNSLGHGGYDPEPWHQADARGRYAPPPQQIGLMDVVPDPSPSPRDPPPPRYTPRREDLGREQTPKEMV
jgi:hypothetical protein